LLLVLPKNAYLVPFGTPEKQKEPALALNRKGKKIPYLAACIPQVKVVIFLL
jgi:hypothetical protein